MFDFLKRAAVRKILGEEMLAKLDGIVGWFTAVPTRKRTIAAIAAVIGLGLSTVDQGFKILCDAAVLGGAVCNLHPAGWVVYVQAVNDFVQNNIVRGADAVALIFGAWGLIHARSRNKKQTAEAQAIADSTGKPVKVTLAKVVTDEKGAPVSVAPVTAAKVVEPTPAPAATGGTP